MTIRGCLGGAATAVIGAFMVLVIVSMISMVCTGKAHAQSYHWRDRARLEALADSAGISRKAVLAVAWEESAGNDSTPGLRGHHCWYTIAARADTLWTKTWPHILEPARPVIDTVIVIPRRKHHEQNCEVGRFQIKPSTARLRCHGKNIFTYEGNLACFAKMFFEDSQMGNTLYGGTLWAIRHHNGSGPLADQYVKRVLQTIGWLTVTEGA